MRVVLTLAKRGRALTIFIILYTAYKQHVVKRMEEALEFLVTWIQVTASLLIQLPLTLCVHFSDKTSLPIFHTTATQVCFSIAGSINIINFLVTGMKTCMFVYRSTLVTRVCHIGLGALSTDFTVQLSSTQMLSDPSMH